MDQNTSKGLKGSCPYLGMSDDPATSVAYLSKWNYCHHCKPIARPTLGHQSTFCLSSGYDQCPVYSSAPGQKMPKEIRDRQKLTIGSRHYWTYGGLLMVAVLMIAGTYFGRKMKAKNPEGEGAVTASQSPLRSETPLLIKTKTATATSTKKATETYTLTATFTATATEVPPTQERRHGLDEPIGKDIKFVIHRILEGEYVQQYADLYNTTAEAIYASNFFMPSPIWINWLIIIPVDTTDVADLPVFEAYMVESDGITIEEVAEVLSVEAAELQFYNDLEPGYILHSGEWLLIPRQRQEQ